MKSILVLDDEQTVLDLVKRLLDDRGYATFVASTYAAFQAVLAERQIDLVLLDIRMPAKDGFEVFKDLSCGQHPPVLFVTGDCSSFSVDSQTALNLWQKEFQDGRTDILYKPFTSAVLFEKVEALIGEAEDAS